MLQKIFDHSNDMILVLDPDADRILDANSRACVLLGYSRQELISTPISAIHPDEIGQAFEFLRSVQDTGNGYTEELSCLTKQGERLPAEISASLTQMHGKSCVIALVRDVSHRLQAEKALRESEQLFRDLFEEAPLMYFSIGTDGRILRVNRQVTRTLGYSPRDLVGKPVKTIYWDTEEAHKRAEKIFKRFKSGNQIRDEEVEVKTADGRRLWGSLSVQAIRDEQGNIVASRSILVDITARKQAEQESRYLQEEIKRRHDFEEIVGGSPAIRKVFSLVEKVAETDTTVLIMGETGTGKELFARALHSRSRRSTRALISVNCSTLPPGLVESELFGHEKGSFTGATGRKIGRFELADGGTLFLDEIGELPPEAQVKLLRVLQEREFERVGGNQTIRVDVRMIAATNRKLEKEVQDGRFRSDLFYRLNVFPIAIPPLRERKEDIPLLVHYFVDKYSVRLGKRIHRVAPTSLKRCLEYHWLGNIRELENLVERAIILSSGPDLEISEEFFPQTVTPQGLTLAEIERGHLKRVLERTDWVVEGPRGAARTLGLHPSTLRSRMKKLGISRESS